MLAVVRDSVLQLPILQARYCSKHELHLRRSWWSCFTPAWMVVLRREGIQSPHVESEGDLDDMTLYGEERDAKTPSEN